MGSRISSRGIAAKQRKEGEKCEDGRCLLALPEETPYMMFGMLDLVHCGDLSHRSGRV